ncbi:MAG: MoaD/ThiS family protein [Myxococcota bacterium]
MVTVQFTRHLHSFFPKLEGTEVKIEAATVAEGIRALEALAPGLAFYLCDELGRLRTHVNIFVNTDRVKDRRGLSDPLRDGDTLWILQALSGG